MYNVIVSILFLFILNSTVHAQYFIPKQKHALSLQKDTLIVELLEETTNINTVKNAWLKNEFETYWKFCPIRFSYQSEIDSLINLKREDYSFLIQDNSRTDFTKRKYLPDEFDQKPLSVDVNELIFGKPEYDAYGNAYQDYRMFSFKSYKFNLLQLWKDKLIQTASIAFSQGNLLPSDYNFLCVELERELEYSANDPEEPYINVKSAIEKIKKSTTYILKDSFESKHLKKMDKYWDYPYKLVDLKEQEQLIADHTPNGCYIKFIWSNQHLAYMWAVLDTETNEILAITSFGEVYISVMGIPLTKIEPIEMIKGKHLKYATSKTVQKFNQRND